ncbi:MAG: hypothetical protein U0103_30165, partial [Candidatus Obscuribacterales bacterium]
AAGVAYERKNSFCWSFICAVCDHSRLQRLFPLWNAKGEREAFDAALPRSAISLNVFLVT